MAEDAALARFIPLFQNRASSLVELAGQLGCLLAPAAKLEYDADAVKKQLNAESGAHLAKLRERFAALPDFAEKPLHDALAGYVEENGLKFKAVAPPLRVSLLGFMGGPDLAALMQALGREESLARLDRGIALCGA
ncbi:hypothetical protein LJC36_03410 [Desulfovibrio sp. OttesenSCG-928-C14]|nr:hypothetical protein [Desulfovibrio sp. OttesenSCG-928-C14]